MTALRNARAALLLSTVILVPVGARAQTVPIPAGPPASAEEIGQPSTDNTAQAAPLSASNAAPPRSAGASDDDGKGDIVVTGSRIVANGYRAPTPVTVVSATELLKKAPESIAAGLATLPQFFASSGASSNAFTNQAGRQNSGNYLNLRSLGEIETLLLLDGQRLPPTSPFGTTDANIIPQALIQRVDVVTGGASAAYGSDAVAGVVNFILDTKFEGVKGSAQYGISSRGDDHQVKAALAVGKTFLDNRLHLEASVDYFYQPGIPNPGERPNGGNYTGGWVNVGANPARPCPVGCAANPYTPTFNVRIGDSTYGTLVASARNAAGVTVPFTLNGTTFDPGGGYHLADLGTRTGSSNLNVGGADSSVTFGTSLTSKLKTRQAFARADYDFGGGITGFLQGSYSRANTAFTTVAGGTQKLSFQIFAENPFLPTTFRDAMLAEGVNSFVGSRTEGDQTPKRAYQQTSAAILLAGLKGQIANFNWTLTGSYGDSDLKVKQFGNFEQSRWFAALDAVRGPQGDIVCRVTLTHPGAYPGCLPWNPFGNGSPSAASYAYFEDVSRYRIRSRQSDFAANISGAIFDLPAGPVNIAVGAEYRHQYLKGTSNTDPSQPIDLTGLRAATNPFNLKFNTTNQGKTGGTQDIKEAYGEIAIPILRDTPFFRALDVNAAARYTDYSQSGGIWSWKGGFSWSPIEELRFRGTISRDIRAPVLNELFAGTSATRGTFNDVHTGLNANSISLQRGNPLLKPEKGDTITIGGVWQPSFIPGFSVSLDYYNIKIKDRISSLGAEDLNQLCERSGGTDQLCQFIVRPFPFSDRSQTGGPNGTGNFPTSVSQVPFNQAVLKTHGFDYELSYRMPLGSVLFDEPARLDLRFIGNYTPRLISVTSPTTAPLRLDGTVAGGGDGVPRHKFTASTQFTEGPLSFGFDVRYIGKMKYTRQATVFITNNNLPAAAYLNANISYDLKLDGGRTVTLFAAGSNLTDHFHFAPRLNQQPTGGYPTYPQFYDVVGAYFVGGVKVSL